MGAETKPLTDKELADIEWNANSALTDIELAGRVSADDALQLIAEVRRLRAEVDRLEERISDLDSALYEAQEHSHEE